MSDIETIISNAIDDCGYVQIESPLYVGSVVETHIINSLLSNGYVIMQVRVTSEHNQGTERAA